MARVDASEEGTSSLSRKLISSPKEKGEYEDILFWEPFRDYSKK